MNDETTNLDQADEEILTYTASDEAMEAAAGIEDRPPTFCPTTNPGKVCGGYC